VEHLGSLRLQIAEGAFIQPSNFNLKFNDMKTFLVQNGYKALMGISMLIASIALFISSIQHVIAEHPVGNASGIQFPFNEDGSVTVRLADDQLQKILPLVEEGSILVRFTDAQFNKLVQVQEVDLVKINGQTPAIFREENPYQESQVSLMVRSQNYEKGR
jgi:hypothetical protein